MPLHIVDLTLFILYVYDLLLPCLHITLELELQNNVLELWSLFDFLMPGFLGTEKQVSCVLHTICSIYETQKLY